MSNGDKVKVALVLVVLGVWVYAMHGIVQEQNARRDVIEACEDRGGLPVESVHSRKVRCIEAR